MKARLLITVILLFSLRGLHAQAVGATWLTSDSSAKTATGTLGPASIAVTNLTGASKGAGDFSVPDYSAAPLSTTASAMNYGVGSNYTATFSLPVSGLMLYGQFWRGNGTGVADTVTYTFDHPIEILSGFATASASGNTLTMPKTGFDSGILRFKEPVKTLSLAMNTGSTQGQVFTFGVVPATGTSLTVTGSLKPTTKKGRYLLQGTASATYGIKSVSIKVGAGSFVPVSGTTSWRSSVKVAKPAGKKKKKQTRVQVQATSNENIVSTIKRVVITRRK